MPENFHKIRLKKTRAAAWRARGRGRIAVLVAVVAQAAIGASGARAWGGRVKLVRKYRAGQSASYRTGTETRATVRSTPPGLEAFLPPMPTEISTTQENTVTVRAVNADGSVELENRFDRFELHSDLVDRLPETMKDAARETQDEWVKRIAGGSLSLGFDRDGRLQEFTGADELFGPPDSPFRDPLREAVKFLVEQVSGNALYPGRSVGPKESWQRSLSSAASEGFPFSVEGASTMTYGGKTRYEGARAAIVDFRFHDELTPDRAALARSLPLAQLEAQGLKIDLEISGDGDGRALLALDDGRMLQNRSRFRQKMTARLKVPPGVHLPSNDPITIEISTETSLEVSEIQRKER